ncbi:Fic family protein, partial [Rathayibacter iranicus]|nr:Fic family protein [Rathayibacter iranicus NCPPB 2253 = VKM Ac-1602]
MVVAIGDLTTLICRRDLPPLVLVALSHAQFETIYPFTEGNERTRRALAQSVLRHRGVTRMVAVPVSAGLLSTIRAYDRALSSFREGT